MQKIRTKSEIILENFCNSANISVINIKCPSAPQPPWEVGLINHCETDLEIFLNFQYLRRKHVLFEVICLWLHKLGSKVSFGRFICFNIDNICTELIKFKIINLSYCENAKIRLWCFPVGHRSKNVISLSLSLSPAFGVLAKLSLTPASIEIDRIGIAQKSQGSL